MVPEGHDWVGRDLGEAMGGAPLGVIVTDDALAAMAHAQGVPRLHHAPRRAWASSGSPPRPGPSMWSAPPASPRRNSTPFRAAARHAVIVRAGNMSLGVNLLARLTRMVAAALGEEWDVEIVEAHHRMKVDAPSGTALMLGRAAAEGRGAELAALQERGRDGMTGARRQGAIGFAAVRGGDVVGEHDVIFAGEGERVVLRHLATDRAIFARGALRAALWGQGRSPGEYDMMDVLGLG